MIEDLDEPAGTVAVTVGGTPAVPVVTIAGELDMAGADVVRAALDPMVAPEVEAVAFELDGLTFLDSSGLSVFIEVANRLPVTITSASTAVRRVVTVTGLDDALGLQP